MKISAIVLSNTDEPDFPVLTSAAGECMDRLAAQDGYRRAAEPVFVGRRQHEGMDGFLFEADVEKVDA